MNTVMLTEQDRIVPCENNLVNIEFANGTRLERVEPKRLFPTSDPDHYISFLNEDGSERAMLRDIAMLDEKSKKTLADSLADYYMIPVILSVNDLFEKFDVLYFDVTTDRGNSIFGIRNRFRDVKTYPDGSVRLRDSNDNRYVIPSYETLDRKSRKFLFPFL